MTVRFLRKISRRRFLSSAATTGVGVIAMPYLSRAADPSEAEVACDAFIEETHRGGIVHGGADLGE